MERVIADYLITLTLALILRRHNGNLIRAHRKRLRDRRSGHNLRALHRQDEERRG